MTAVAAALTLAACTQPEATAPPTIEPRPVLATVTWVVDGDTIEVDTGSGESTVRLVGLNTPEQGECFYEAALDHLIETLKDREITLETVGTDQFGRSLAHVFEDDRHVNLELVSLGLAIATTPDGSDPYATVLLEAERSAFVSEVGLWATSACGGSGQRPPVTIDSGNSVTDPEGPDDELLDSESLVIVSEHDTVVDLSGWSLRDESSRHRYRFEPGTLLEPGQTIVVTSGDDGWSPGGEAVWSNGGDMALLVDPDGNIASRWRY